MPQSTARQWDQQYDSGRWDFLDSPREQMRHAVIAAHIASLKPGAVIDVGCGPAHLLAHLNPARTTGYTAVDVSEIAMAQIPESPIEVTRVISPIEQFTPPPGDYAALIASEVLYFLDRPDEQLARLVDAMGKVGCVAVSMLAPRADKPNWTRGSKRVWGAIDRLGWTKQVDARLWHAHENAAWDVRIFRP